MQGEWTKQLTIRGSRELTWASYAMNVRHWGPVIPEQDHGARERGLFGFHIVNVGLHAVSCIILWYAYLRLGRKHPWLSAMTFAVHPLAVPSVAYVSGRAGVMAGSFGFLSLAAMVSSGGPVSMIPFGLACLAKEDSGMMLGAIYSIGKIQKTRGRSLLLLAALLGLVWKRVALKEVFHQNGDAGMQQGGFPKALTSPDYQATAWTELLKRLPLWIVGQKQCVDPKIQRYSWKDPVAWLGPAILIYMMATACRSREGRIAAAWILGSPLFLYPFIPMPDPVMDYRAYFTLGGICYGLGAILDRRPELAILMLPYLFIKSFQRVGVYRTDRTFWESSLRDGGREDRALINQGVAFWNESFEALDKRNRAKDAFAQALALNPDLAIPRSNLGSMAKDEGRFDEAIAHLEETVKRTPSNYPSWYLLGTVFEKVGRWDAAIKAYETCLAIEPRYAIALNRLGLVLVVKSSDFARAERLFWRAIDAHQAHGRKPEYVYNRAWTLHMLGRHEEHVAEMKTLPPQMKVTEDMLKVEQQPV